MGGISNWAVVFGYYEHGTWIPSPDGPSAALEMEVFEQVIQDLRTHGVKMLIEPFEKPVRHMTVTADPVGNGIVIHKRK